VRFYTVVGLKEGTKDDFESIITSANLPEVEKVIEKLQKNNGGLSQRQRFTQVDILTNDHVRQRFTFGARRDTIEAVQAEEAKRHKAEQARIEQKRSEDATAAAEKVKTARAQLDTDNLAAKEALAVSLGLKKSPASDKNKTNPPVEPEAAPGEQSDRKND
jgi:hypothetical protein